MKRILSKKCIFYFSFALSIWMGIFSVSSILFADNRFFSTVYGENCADCILSHSKEHSDKNRESAFNQHDCTSHTHCHHQPGVLKTIVLTCPRIGQHFVPLDNQQRFLQLITSIFRPPESQSIYNSAKRPR